MRRATIALMLCFLLTAFAPRALAQTQEPPMAFTWLDHPRGFDIAALGRITPETPAQFERFLATRRGTAPVTTVILGSGGGNLDAGIALGRRFRDLGVGTMIEEGGYCISACAYAFLGGANRFVDQENFDAKVEDLGFHGFSYGDGNLTSLSPEARRALGDQVTIDVQEMTSRLSVYVAEMGVSTELVAIASRIPPNQVIVFTPRELSSLGIIPSEEADFTTFNLVPDGDGLMAVALREHRQFMFACALSPDGRHAPYAVFSRRIAAGTGPAGAIEAPIPLSSLTRLAPLPWIAGPDERRAFYDWAARETAQRGPLYSRLRLHLNGATASQDRRGEVPVSASNTRLLMQAGLAHAAVELPIEFARAITTASNFSLFLLTNADIDDQGLPPPMLGHGFQNTPAEQAVVRAALRPCI